MCDMEWKDKELFIYFGKPHQYISSEEVGSINPFALVSSQSLKATNMKKVYIFKVLCLLLYRFGALKFHGACSVWGGLL